MNYCKDCRWRSRLYRHLCTHPAVREAHSDRVHGVPPYVSANLERGVTCGGFGSTVCGLTGKLFEKREPLTYRFFLWLFGGPAKGHKGRT